MVAIAMLKFHHLATNQTVKDDPGDSIKCNRQSETNSSQREQKPQEVENYLVTLKGLERDGKRLRADRNQPNIGQKPSWFDESQFENAKSIYSRHFMAVNFAHLSGLLILVRITSIYRTLSATGKSDSVAKLFKRYYDTLVHVRKWYEGDIFDENSESYRSLLIVRGMHSRVSSNLNDGADKLAGDATDFSSASHMQQVTDQTSNPAALDPQENFDYDANIKHISEYDIMITQFAFVGFIVTKARYVGLLDDFDQKDLESLLHFWRVIGYYLGATDRFNLCSGSVANITGLCEAIQIMEFKGSVVANPIHSPPGIMSVNIIRASNYIPMLTVFGILKYVYELLEVDSSEIEHKQTRYSRFSYTIMKLVMTRLLAYKLFRSFNNGLTRLSVFLVSKLENWYSRRLDSKYGQILKL